MNISAYRADYLPLIGQLMNQMRLPQIINEAMAIPKSQAIVDAGTMISGMILNLLSDAKIRLYRMSQFFEDKPMPLIFPWKPDLDSSNFTEERAGNVLDDFYRSNPQKVFSMLTQTATLNYTISIQAAFEWIQRVRIFMGLMRPIGQSLSILLMVSVKINIMI